MRTATEDKRTSSCRRSRRAAQHEVERAGPRRRHGHVRHHQHGHRQHRRACRHQCGADKARGFGAKTTADGIRHKHQKAGRHGHNPEHRLLSADELRQRQQHRQARRIRRHDHRRLREMRPITERAENSGRVRRMAPLDEWLLDFADCRSATTQPGWHSRTRPSRRSRGRHTVRRLVSLRPRTLPAKLD